ncbi:MAG: cytochrome c-type biogenesis protein CcmH, partial [Nitrospinota bacterium]
MTRRRPLAAAVVLALGLWGSQGLIGAAQEPPDPMDIAKSIMSPVCPGRLIADCPSPEAEQLREIIRRQVVEGKSKQEIIDYFVEVYGKRVLPSPPQKGWYLTAWYLPLAAILSGGAVIFLLIRIWSRGEQDGGPPAGTGPQVPDDPEYQKYARVLDE